ncbi:hypothetical protein EHI44_14405 [Rhizobium leguminosarum]|uniref:Uncharacterized protein n=1 Tax=Rhizobium leguminosarum TaxID=384 RepID=A0ABD7PTF1_RHILE|nr:hypothetical protein EHI44_14405 [Rhizobium leguminosarum]TAV74628.1 hypothetical protein ELI28_14330 [Rhizobium leguminosarum]TAV79227.1 hypothetical protein ELI27_14320 [Rhizobium leguminosarum]TAW30638.1 hypothetical protein ELI19_14510 [Rhizobium leguminosarum]TAW44365.1 hypothetical protein ELI18_14465 [Rhizobium leguminosarum]
MHKRRKRLYRGRASLSSGYRIGSKIAMDFRKARREDSNCYSILCASSETRGSVDLQSTKSIGIY